MKTPNQVVNKSFEVITECFSGADGGFAFVNLRIFIEEMECRGRDGDEAATQLLTIMVRFAKLIEVANQKP